MDASRAAACFLVAFLAIALPLPSQSPSPDPHWGADIFPGGHQELRATMPFNRFTVFSKTGNPNDPSSPTFNEIKEASGFNVGSLSYTDELVISRGGRWTFTFNAGVGWSSDQPTRFLQNDYVHELLGLSPVPVGLKRTSTELILAAQANHWWGSANLWPEDRAIQGGASLERFSGCRERHRHSVSRAVHARRRIALPPEAGHPVQRGAQDLVPDSE